MLVTPKRGCIGYCRKPLTSLISYEWADGSNQSIYLQSATILTAITEKCNNKAEAY